MVLEVANMPIKHYSNGGAPMTRTVGSASISSSMASLSVSHIAFSFLAAAAMTAHRAARPAGK